jgi:hypothetical protein
MLLPPQRKARWLANMAAAGVEPDEATIARVEAGLAERLDDLDRVLGQLDFHGSNPDYLRSRKEMGVGDERA